jgi:hypothetical protein
MTDYQKRYESVMKAINALQRELSQVKAENNRLTLEKIQWENEKLKQQTIIASTLTAANNSSNAVLAENQQLREEIQRLKG